MACSSVGHTNRSELERVNFDTERSDVLLFEFTSQVTLDKGGLLWTSV